MLQTGDPEEAMESRHLPLGMQDTRVSTALAHRRRSAFFSRSSRHGKVDVTWQARSSVEQLHSGTATSLPSLWKPQGLGCHAGAGGSGWQLSGTLCGPQGAGVYAALPRGPCKVRGSAGGHQLLGVARFVGSVSNYAVKQPSVKR